jgi:hypothetical protein
MNESYTTFDGKPMSADYERGWRAAIGEVNALVTQYPNLKLTRLEAIVEDNKLVFQAAACQVMGIDAPKEPVQ